MTQYSVSTAGRVRHAKTGRIRKTSLTNGYPGLGIFTGRERKTCLVHHLVAAAFLPRPQGEAAVRHKNGDRADNRVENLEWALRTETPEAPAAETWKPVVKYEGLYEVSDCGRVRSARTTTRTHAGLILRPSPTAGSYLGVTLCRDGKPTSLLVHRLVAIAFLGSPFGRQVNHKDGDRQNNRVENLEWVTPRENQRHRYEVNGRVRQFRGENNPRGKLTAESVQEIRRLWSTRPMKFLRSDHPLSLEGLAERFGVKPQAISRIVCGNAWAHLKPDQQPDQQPEQSC